MFLFRLAAGLVFLVGVGLSRLGVGAESWPLLALGLLAATVGLWHFIVGGTATSKVHLPPRRSKASDEAAETYAADVSDVRTH